MHPEIKKFFLSRFGGEIDFRPYMDALSNNIYLTNEQGQHLIGYFETPNIIKYLDPVVRLYFEEKIMLKRIRLLAFA